MSYRADDGAREHLAAEQIELQRRRREHDVLMRELAALEELRADLDRAITARRGKTPTARSFVKEAVSMFLALVVGVASQRWLDDSSGLGIGVLVVAAALYALSGWRSTKQRKVIEKQLAELDARMAATRVEEDDESESESESESAARHST